MHDNHSRLVQDITFLERISLTNRHRSSQADGPEIWRFSEVTQIYNCDNCLCYVHQSIWNANIIEILMYLLLYTCSFCYFSCSGDPHRIVQEMNSHSDELGNRPYCLVVQLSRMTCHSRMTDHCVFLVTNVADIT